MLFICVEDIDVTLVARDPPELDMGEFCAGHWKGHRGPSRDRFGRVDGQCGSGALYLPLLRGSDLPPARLPCGTSCLASRKDAQRQAAAKDGKATSAPLGLSVGPIAMSKG
jgi:hypothetical protein